MLDRLLGYLRWLHCLVGAHERYIAGGRGDVLIVCCRRPGCRWSREEGVGS